MFWLLSEGIYKHQCSTNYKYIARQNHTHERKPTSRLAHFISLSSSPSWEEGEGLTARSRLRITLATDTEAALFALIWKPIFDTNFWIRVPKNRSRKLFKKTSFSFIIKIIHTLGYRCSMFLIIYSDDSRSPSANPKIRIFF